MTFPGTSEPLVPTNREQGERQQIKSEMELAGLPTDLAAAPPVAQAGPQPRATESSTRSSGPLDALQMLDPLGGAAPTPTHPLDELEAIAQASGNFFILSAIKRARGQ